MRSRFDIQRQKLGKLPKHCAVCRSSRLVAVDSTESVDGKIIHFKGMKCLKCNFINARRLI